MNADDVHASAIVTVSFSASSCYERRKAVGFWQLDDGRIREGDAAEEEQRKDGRRLPIDHVGIARAQGGQRRGPAIRVLWQEDDVRIEPCDLCPHEVVAIAAGVNVDGHD